MSTDGDTCLTDAAQRQCAPVDALRCQAGGGQDLLDVAQPVGGFQLAKPPVHVVRLVITGFHEFD